MYCYRHEEFVSVHNKPELLSENNDGHKRKFPHSAVEAGHQGQGDLRFHPFPINRP